MTGVKLPLLTKTDKEHGITEFEIRRDHCASKDKSKPKRPKISEVWLWVFWSALPLAVERSLGFVPHINIHIAAVTFYSESGPMRMTLNVLSSTPVCRQAPDWGRTLKSQRRSGISVISGIIDKCL